jgi:long-chain acyl-CoA synthetase
VAEAAVIGVPHERLGEEVMAVVTLREGATVTEAGLHAYCRERMAAYKYPRRFEFRTELPKNSLGKVLKDQLIPQEEQKEQEEQGAMAAHGGKDESWNA